MLQAIVLDDTWNHTLYIVYHACVPDPISFVEDLLFPAEFCPLIK